MCIKKKKREANCAKKNTDQEYVEVDIKKNRQQ